MHLVCQFPDQVVLEGRVDRRFQAGSLRLLQVKTVAGLQLIVRNVVQFLSPLHHILQRSDPQFRVQRRNTLPN